MSSRLIGQEDWKGDNGNSVATEDNNDNDVDAEAGRVRVQFHRGRATSTLRGAFWEDDTNDDDERDK
jgi:hypothetical protein